MGTTSERLAEWLVENGYAEERGGDGVEAETLADALLGTFDIEERTEWIDPNQHCTYPFQDGTRDYSFSHTAAYCGKPQPRRCGCAFATDHQPEEKA